MKTLFCFYHLSILRFEPWCRNPEQHQKTERWLLLGGVWQKGPGPKPTPNKQIYWQTSQGLNSQDLELLSGSNQMSGARWHDGGWDPGWTEGSGCGWGEPCDTSTQRRLPDFTASTRLSDKFKIADAADDATVTRFSKCQEEYSTEDVDRLAFLRIMTSSISLECFRSKTWRITPRIGACQACLHLMCMFTGVCACEIHRRELNEACRCACPDGIAPSKVSTSSWPLKR